MPEGSLTKKGENFLAMFVKRNLFKNPKFLRSKEKKCHKQIRAAGPGERAKEISARKELAHIERRRLMVDLIAQVEMAKPDLMKADRHDTMVRKVRSVYTEYRATIDAVDETQSRRKARAALKDIEAEMTARFEDLLDEIFSYELKGGEPEADLAAGKSVIIWTGDLGESIKAQLSDDLDFIEIGTGPMELVLTEDILDAFEEDQDKITPMALQQEVNEMFKATLANCLDHVDGLHTLRKDILDELRDDDTKDPAAKQTHFEVEVSKYVSDVITPALVDETTILQHRIKNAIQVRWKQTVQRRKTLKHRKLKIGLKFVTPVLGVIVGAVAIGVAVGLTTTGIGAVAGAGIGLASVAILRSSLSMAKMAYEQIRSIEALTKNLEEDLEGLAKSYGHARNAKEISKAVLNSFTAWPVKKSLPTVNSRFDTIEARVAAVTDLQRKQHVAAEEALKALAADREAAKAEFAGKENVEKFLDAKFDDAGKSVDAMFSAVGDLGKETLGFQTKFARIREMLNQLNDLISSGVKLATAIIPVVTELAFLIANVSVGLAGVAEAATKLEAVAGATVALVGEVVDGAGTIETAADS